MQTLPQAEPTRESRERQMPSPKRRGARLACTRCPHPAPNAGSRRPRDPAQTHGSAAGCAGGTSDLLCLKVNARHASHKPRPPETGGVNLLGQRCVAAVSQLLRSGQGRVTAWVTRIPDPIRCESGTASYCKPSWAVRRAPFQSELSAAQQPVRRSHWSTRTTRHHAIRYTWLASLLLWGWRAGWSPVLIEQGTWTPWTGQPGQRAHSAGPKGGTDRTCHCPGHLPFSAKICHWPLQVLPSAPAPALPDGSRISARRRAPRLAERLQDSA